MLHSTVLSRATSSSDAALGDVLGTLRGHISDGRPDDSDGRGGGDSNRSGDGIGDSNSDTSSISP